MSTETKRIDGSDGVPGEQTAFNPDLDMVKLRYLLGESIYALSRRLKISRRIIQERLVSDGVRIRSRKEVNKLRYADSTIEERKAITAAANTARRGSKSSIQERETRAKGVERVGRVVSPYEQLFQEYLRQVGVVLTPQKAIGIYNPDFASNSVIVEIFGGNFHHTRIHAARDPVKFKYFLKRGFNVIVVWTNNREKRLTIDAAKYVASIIERTDSDLSFRGKYRVIRGDGKLAPELGPHL